jgi:signal transduction histidine kinase
MGTERLEWPLRKHWIDLAWGAFAALNLVAMLVFASWETVPFHFIWVSLTLLYGFRVWALKPTMWTLAGVMLASATFIGIDVSRGFQPIDEITEVPLMAAMFVAMVWHARRRLHAMEQANRVSEANLRLLKRELQFTQDASHELRTPITIALGHVELIQRSVPDPLIAEDVAIALDELLRLRKIADRLLLLASAEHPDFLQRVPTDVPTLVMDAVRRWSATPRAWAVGNLAPAHVDVDVDRIALALDSLIDNAVKHSSPSDRIELSCMRGASTASIVVSDSGDGIPTADQARIFDRFARTDSSRSREAGGVGLGLSIVAAIAEAHGGSVSAESKEGGGSVFTLNLPLLNGSLEAAERASARPQFIPAGGSGPAPR